MSDGAMIVMIFAIIIFVPLICIFAIYKISRRRRKSKNERYTCCLLYTSSYAQS